MRRVRLPHLAFVATAVAGSQLGHGAVFLVRFGGSPEGVHAYLPAFTGVLTAAAGGVLMTCLAVLAAARLLGAASPGCRPRRSLGYFDLLPALFVAQALIFVGQETVESLAAGAPVPSAIEQLFWAGLGQLPAAAVAAAVLSWLSARMEAAWTVLLSGTAPLAPGGLVVAGPPSGRPKLAPVPALAAACPRALRKRGPPPDRLSRAVR